MGQQIFGHLWTLLPGQFHYLVAGRADPKCGDCAYTMVQAGVTLCLIWYVILSLSLPLIGGSLVHERRSYGFYLFYRQKDSRRTEGPISVCNAVRVWGARPRFLMADPHFGMLTPPSFSRCSHLLSEPNHIKFWLLKNDRSIFINSQTTTSLPDDCPQFTLNGGDLSKIWVVYAYNDR